MKKKIIVAAAILVPAAIAVWFGVSKRSTPERVYRFVTVEKGDLEAVVSATGMIDAVTRVEVGTQVSGIVSQIFVDFNDTVERGQVIARLDTTLLGVAVREARANLARALAESNRAERDYSRIKEMFAERTVSEAEMDAAEYSVESARASVRSAETDVERAKQSMRYATIYAPISGIVINRGVDVGQTVAASLSAPILFVIANDLSQLQILASVDESDIGLIKNGLRARFRVQAYPEKAFDGVVRQVRLQSTVEENVVNYTVVVDVDNPEGILLPGMTATVDFIVETATGVLKVANTALRFRPTSEMVEEIRKSRSAPGEREGAGRAHAMDPLGGAGSAQGETAPSNLKRLYYLDDGGRLAAVVVRTGVTDGTSTEIEGPGIKEGMEIIASATQSAQKSSSNPFGVQQQQSPRPGPPGPGF
jgi:HlyD family secretion protein